MVVQRILELPVSIKKLGAVALCQTAAAIFLRCTRKNSKNGQTKSHFYHQHHIYPKNTIFAQAIHRIGLGCAGYQHFYTYYYYYFIMGSAFNALDIAFLLAIGYGVYRGVTQGLIGSVLTVFRFVISIVLALRLNNIMTRVLVNSGRFDGNMAPIVSFFVLFCGFMVAMFILGLVLNFFVKAAHLSSISRLTGIALWAFMLTVGFSFVTSLGDKGGLLTTDLKRSSKVYPVVEPIADVMMCKMYFVAPAMSQIMQSFQTTLGSVGNALVGDCRSGDQPSDPYNE